LRGARQSRKEESRAPLPYLETGKKENEEDSPSASIEGRGEKGEFGEKKKKKKKSSASSEVGGKKR